MSKSMTRRELLERSALAGAALSVSGLAAFGATKPAYGRMASGAAGKTSLVILEPSLAFGLDYESSAQNDQYSVSTMTNLYDRLIDHARIRETAGVLAPVDGAYVGRLATSWEQNGLEWTFRLRRGVRSHAGNELTADDVIYTFARGKSVSGAAACAAFLLNVGSVLGPEVFDPKATARDKELRGEIKKVDNYTVKIKQFEPNALFPSVLSIFCLGIFDAKEMNKHATASDPWAHNWSNTRGAAGYGAYRLKSWVKEESLTLEANPNYYRGKPAFPALTFQKVPQSTNRIAAIQTGAADVVTGLSPREFSAIAKSKKAEVLTWFGNGNIFLAPNYKFEPWSAGGDRAKSRLLRQALAYAIPYDEIVAADFFGSARKWNGIISSDFLHAKQYPGRYVTDYGKARELLARAGHPNGKGLTGPGLELTYVAERQSLVQPIANRIQTSLGRVGVNLKLNPIPQAQFAERQGVTLDIPLSLDDQEIAIGPDAGYMTQLFLIPGSVPGGIDDFTNYNSPAVISLYLKQKGAAATARKASLGQLQDILIEDLPWIPIVETATQIAVRPGLKGWAPNLDRGTDYWNLRM